MFAQWLKLDIVAKVTKSVYIFLLKTNSGWYLLYEDIITKNIDETRYDKTRGRELFCFWKKDWTDGRKEGMNKNIKKIVALVAKTVSIRYSKLE